MRSDPIRHAPLDVLEVGKSCKEEGGPTYQRDQIGRRRRRRVEDGPSKAVDHTYYRVDCVQPARGAVDERAWKDHRTGEQPYLNQEAEDVADVPIERVQRREP